MGPLECFNLYRQGGIIMTKKDAIAIIKEFNSINVHSDEDIFAFTEAAEYLIEKFHDTRAMMNLGGWYYEQRQFDLALKYYDMAAVYGSDAADECLGYIWYYGRTGERDYKKAFEHFEAAMKKGNIVATYKVADMYKNGYYVDQDYEKYKEIIESLYPKFKNDWDDPWVCNYPITEIFTRLARIRKDEGKRDEAVELYEKAKVSLAFRIGYNPFFGNLNMMKWLIDDLYTLKKFDINDADFFDLYYLLKTPGTINIKIDDKPFELKVEEDGAECAVCFDDTWYRNRDEFFAKAHLGEVLLTDINGEIMIISKGN